MSDVRTLTVRLPRETYEALRGFAFVMDRSMNEVVGQAVNEYLAGPGRRQQFETLLERAGNDYRAALDKLAD